MANFALTLAKALLVLCVAMFILINPDIDGVKPKAEYLVTVEWTGHGRYDIDTWTRLPDGRRINYQSREAGVVFLERDDLGNDCAKTTTNSKALNVCEEITVIRGIVAGDYVVILHLFSANFVKDDIPCDPVQVKVKLTKLNPKTTIVWQTVVTLDQIRQEKPIVRFMVNNDAKVDQFETDNIEPVVYQTRKP